VLPCRHASCHDQHRQQLLCSAVCMSCVPIFLATEPSLIQPHTLHMSILYAGTKAKMGMFSKKKAADADVGSADIAAGDAATARVPSDAGAMHSSHSDKNPFVDSSGTSAPCVGWTSSLHLVANPGNAVSAAVPHEQRQKHVAAAARNEYRRESIKSRQKQQKQQKQQHRGMTHTLPGAPREHGTASWFVVGWSSPGTSQVGTPHLKPIGWPKCIARWTGT
jgi:hypothetical protein